MMENAEEILHTLEEFSKTSPKYIPHELDDYLGYVAKTGDPVFKWSIIKCLYREKLTSVIADFHEESLSIEVPPCPNVDPFNYERMKANLLDKLESFNGAPFTVQRLSELLTNPRKEYNRADKFMRAVEKNILVVSTIEPGRGAENDLVDEQFNGVPESETAGAEMAPHDRLPETESPNVPYETVQEREPVDDDRQVFAGDEPPDGMPKAAEREAVADVKPAFEETMGAWVGKEEEDRFMWVKSLRPSTAAETEEKSSEEPAAATASTSSSGQDAVALSSDALLLDPLLNFIPVNSRWSEEEKMLGLNQMSSVDAPVSEAVVGENIVGEGVVEVGEGVVEVGAPDAPADRKEFDSFLMSSNAASSSYEASEVEGVEPKRRRCEDAGSEVAEPPSQSPEVTESAEVVDSPAKSAETIDTSEQVGSTAEVPTTEPERIEVDVSEQEAEPSSEVQMEQNVDEQPISAEDSTSPKSEAPVECDTSEAAEAPAVEFPDKAEDGASAATSATEEQTPAAEGWEAASWQETEDKSEDKPSPKVEDEGSNSGSSVSDENVVSSCQDEASNESKIDAGNGESAAPECSPDEQREATVIHTTSAEVDEPMDVGECQTTSSEIP